MSIAFSTGLPESNLICPSWEVEKGKTVNRDVAMLTGPIFCSMNTTEASITNSNHRDLGEESSSGGRMKLHSESSKEAAAVKLSDNKTR